MPTFDVALVACALFAVALVASLIPAFRAANMDPKAALQTDWLNPTW
jgi:ABC-type lipoprotein release transport system permease subunit